MYLVELHIYYKMIHGPYHVKLLHCFSDYKCVLMYMHHLHAVLFYMHCMQTKLISTLHNHGGSQCP